ncbi:MAG: hypothetical protein ISR83_00240 [Candidatus Marinimicrobia bacterium]|nr:hypothetical protein [Candidatus Neomarinimicrobiota bacterium]
MLSYLFGQTTFTSDTAYTDPASSLDEREHITFTKTFLKYSIGSFATFTLLNQSS